MSNIQSNELIARFMGVEIKMDMMGNENPDYNCWDFLMPVINEIESTKAEVTIRSTTCQIWHPNQKDGSIYIDEPAMTKFEATYRAVVEYIEWYNLNSKTPLSIIKNNG